MTMKKFTFTLFAFCLFDFAQSMLLPSAFVHSQWVQQTVPVSKPITGIKFIDSLKGWACTDYGTQHDTCYIIYTSNGGTNWVIQNSQYNTIFQSMNMIDASTGYVGGYAFSPGPGTIIVKTTDGGLNWTTIPAGTSSGVTDMYFLNADSGYMCSSLFINLYTTTNGGQNWELRTNGINASVYRLFFLNYNTGYAGAASNLYKTTNAGLSWFQLSPFSSETVYAVYFFDELTGFIGLTNHQIGKTTNGGSNWNIKHVFDPRPEVISDIYFVNNNTGYAGTGWLQRILKTTDAGLNWGYQIVSTGSIRISVLNDLNVWSAQYGISRTTNGGGNIVYEDVKQISGNVPEDYKLYQNYPNPFNPSTKIKYDLPQKENVNVKVFDVLGNEIKTIVNESQNGGSYEAEWDASYYPSGIYFARLTAGEYAKTIKMILIK